MHYNCILISSNRSIENMQKMSQIANERDLFKRKYDHLNGKVKKLEEEDLNGKKQKLPDTAIC